MKCPMCDVDLLMTTRQEVEIDYCPKCRGVWLDRGEIDKIIERSVGETDSYSPTSHSKVTESPNHYEPEYRHTAKPKRKGSFLSELFESFGD